MSATEDSRGDLWFGTLEGGLVRYRNGEFRLLRRQDGLFDDTAWAIVDDGLGYLWVSCARGLARMALRDLDAYLDGSAPRVRYRLFGVDDGLASGTFEGGNGSAGIRARDGKLWFATMKGAARVDPARRSSRCPSRRRSSKRRVERIARSPSTRRSALRPGGQLPSRDRLHGDPPARPESAALPLPARRRRPRLDRRRGTPLRRVSGGPAGRTPLRRPGFARRRELGGIGDSAGGDRGAVLEAALVLRRRCARARGSRARHSAGARRSIAAPRGRARGHGRFQPQRRWRPRAGGDRPPARARARRAVGRGAATGPRGARGAGGPAHRGAARHGARARPGGHGGALRRLAAAAASRGGDDGRGERRGSAGRALSRGPPARSPAGLGRDRVRPSGGRGRARPPRAGRGSRAALGARRAGGDGARGRLAGAGGDALAARLGVPRRMAAARPHGAARLRDGGAPRLRRHGDGQRSAPGPGVGLQRVAGHDGAHRRGDRPAGGRAHPVARRARGRGLDGIAGGAGSMAAAARDSPASGRDRPSVGAEDRRLPAHRAHRRRRHGRGLSRRERARRHPRRGEDPLSRADRRSDGAQASGGGGRDRRGDFSIRASSGCSNAASTAGGSISRWSSCRATRWRSA